MTNRNRGKHIKRTATKHGDNVIHAPPPGAVSDATPIPTRRIPLIMPSGTRLTFWQSVAYLEFPAGAGFETFRLLRENLDQMESQMRHYDPPMAIQQTQQPQALPPAQPGVAPHAMASQSPPQGQPRPQRATKPVETSPDCVHFGNLCSGIHCMCPCGCKQKGPFVAGVPHENAPQTFTPSPAARPNAVQPQVAQQPESPANEHRGVKKEDAPLAREGEEQTGNS